MHFVSQRLQPTHQHFNHMTVTVYKQQFHLFTPNLKLGRRLPCSWLQDLHSERPLHFLISPLNVPKGKIDELSQQTSKVY